MAWFSVYINNVSIILASNQVVQESDLAIIFMKAVNPDLRLNFNRKCGLQKILVPTVHGVDVGGTGRSFETRKK